MCSGLCVFVGACVAEIAVVALLGVTSTTEPILHAFMWGGLVGATLACWGIVVGLTARLVRAIRR